MTDLQAVFKQFYGSYKEQYPVSHEQAKVAKAIMTCRTAELGGHINRCESCGQASIAYNSCRNRHCPLCQSIKREKWRIDRNADLLNCHYFHVVFTLPDTINPLALRYPRLIYNTLMKAAADTLKIFAANKRYLGAEMGFTGILHTWGQTLALHPHVHFIVPGAGICPLTKKLKRTHPKFLFPVKALSRVFRAIFIKALKAGFKARGIDMNDAPFQELIQDLYTQKFVVFSKNGFASPSHVVNYLCQYTHRIAISNHRIKSISDTSVTFTYKDYRQYGEMRTMTLSGVEFIRRFMMHVLPKGFVKIRHYGMFAGRNRPTKLAFCQRLMNIQPTQKASAYTTLEFMRKFLAIDLTRCSKCESKDLTYLPLDSS